MRPCSKCGHENDSGARFCDQCAAPLTADPTRATLRPAAPGGKKLVPRLATAALVIGVFALAFFLGGGSSSSVEGEIRSAGRPHGDFVMAPPACHSGDHESFFGVLIASEIETIGDSTGVRGGLKLLKSPAGDWEAYLENPSTCVGFQCQVRKVERERCRIYDVDVENSGTVINTVRVREGHARLDCAFAEGGTLRVDLSFEGCD